MPLYFVGLGANTPGPLGPPVETLAWTRQRLEEIGELRASEVFVTTPMHRSDQPDYANQVVSLETILSPRQLHARLTSIESAGGRDRSREVRYGSRPLDLDVLLVNDVVLSSPFLTVPHPRMHLRPFVLIPLLQLAPAMRDPRSGLPWRAYPAARGGAIGSRPSLGESI